MARPGAAGEAGLGGRGCFPDAAEVKHGLAAGR